MAGGKKKSNMRKVVAAKTSLMKKMISEKDPRLKSNVEASEKAKAEAAKKEEAKRVPHYSSSLFYTYNMNLGPPFRILLDTNFINFSIKNKMDIIDCAVKCLYAKCIPCISECVVGELEKLGKKYKVALKIIRDPRYQILPCLHKGTYADDCIIERVTQHKCYIVGTCDKDLKRRIRKIPGVPIMYMSNHRYSIERMPDAYGAPRL
ncbi:rRNA-processing protein FCF1 homolog [Symsagittifera roscoffensis]|uniref:rRNA-processing protein FCF1 homolog n=1 Tax=Symsagittifera roscoffensis TaxID=84072 RepID=UPI00307C5682